MPLQGQFPPPLAQPLTPSVNEGEAGKSGNAPDSLSSQSQLPSGTQTSHLLEFFFFFFLPAPAACGSSWARHHQTHTKVGPELLQ